MGGLFGGGGTPVVQPVAEAPKTSDAEVQEALRKERELERRRKGRRSTILTGAQGIVDENSGGKTRLGE